MILSRLNKHRSEELNQKKKTWWWLRKENSKMENGSFSPSTQAISKFSKTARLIYAKNCPKQIYDNG